MKILFVCLTTYLALSPSWALQLLAFDLNFLNYYPVILRSLCLSNGKEWDSRSANIGRFNPARLEATFFSAVSAGTFVLLTEKPSQVRIVWRRLPTLFKPSLPSPTPTWESQRESGTAPSRSHCAEENSRKQPPSFHLSRAQKIFKAWGCVWISVFPKCLLYLLCHTFLGNKVLDGTWTNSQSLTR